MSSSSNVVGTGNCDCGVPVDSVPTLINSPGLPALSYRVGTYSSFRQRLIEQLAVQTVPPTDPAATNRPLAALQARATSDPTIALLDAWAMVMDVLSFYQERIVNEGYLRTATERRSVLELGRASGYELHSGVAATGYLAFTAEDSANSPKVAAVPAGTKVQSLPGPGELPQTFETQADFGARAAWNQLRPRLTQPQALRLKPSGMNLILVDPNDSPRTYLYLAGLGLNLKPGDMLLLVDRSAGTVKTLPVLVNMVTPDSSAGRTRVSLSAGSDVATPFFPPTAPPAGTLDIVPKPLTHDYVKDFIVGRSWDEGRLSGQIGIQRWNEQDLLRYTGVIVGEAADSIEVYALRQRLGFFGNNAPLYATLNRADLAYHDYPYLGDGALDWDGTTPRPIWRRATTTTQLTPPIIYAYNCSAADPGLGADVFLERSAPEIVPGSFVVFRSPTLTAVYLVQGTVERALTEFAVTGKSTGLQLATTQDLTTRINDTTDKPEPQLLVRNTMAFGQSERLKLAPWPIDDPLAAEGDSIMLAGMTLGLSPGQPVWLRGEQVDVAGLVQDQVVLLRDIVHAGGYTTLRLYNTLGRSYRRGSVTINANVAFCSHGESNPAEVLGSGDATQQNQSFVLKKPNVTYLPVATASGAQSTVAVTVNGVPWTEVASLYNLDGRSQSFTLRSEDDGTTSVIFGDGDHGARLPSGTENVVATYRTADAAAGAIAAGRLSQLKTRPLGIRDVTNPLPTTGNSAAESIEQGRTNAPLATQLIDRIVTLADYQGFAGAFPGIAKAYARLLWNGRLRLVHLTIAGQDGSAVAVDSPLQTNLLRAIASAADPAQSVEIASYQPRYFVIAAEVVIAPGSASGQVLADAQAALLATFSFARRSFAQAVTAAEVATTLQAVPGIAATVLRRLALLDDTSVGGPPPARLPAGDTFYDPAMPHIQPAELLLLSPAGITLLEIVA